MLDVYSLNSIKRHTHFIPFQYTAIDNKLIVDNDGSHSARLKSGRVALESGLHTIRVLYFEDYMGEELNVYYSNKKQEKIPIPNNVLYHNKN